MNIINEIKQAYSKANITEKLVYINVFVFFVSLFAKDFIIEWLSVPTDISDFIVKPWTIITYAFIHNDIFHILANLLILYYIGNLFLSFFNKKQFVNFYFIGALFGASIFILYNYITQKNGLPLGGASAAVTAIFVGVATKVPQYELRLRLFGSVKLWVLAAIWVGLSLLQLASNNIGGPIAHLTGAAFGYLYATQLSKGNDIGKWFETLLNTFSNLFKGSKTKPLRTVHKSSTKKNVNSITNANQRKINDILDKISKSGYETLTKEEKDFLFKQGKN